jgi:F-type H+-transporting ATPase subunit gamma
LFVSLSRALAQSIASENVSRMASMQRAERNISQHVETLQGQFSQQRQTSITEELLDIIGGFEALTTLRRT